MIRSRPAASRAPAAPLRGRFAPPDPAGRSQGTGSDQGKGAQGSTPQNGKWPIAEPLANTAAMQVSGRRPAARTVGVHRRLSTDGHGRAVPVACSGLTAGDGLVRVEVTDRSGPEVPELYRAGRDAEGGRGLQLVAGLAARWGWRQHGGR